MAGRGEGGFKETCHPRPWIFLRAEAMLLFYAPPAPFGTQCNENRENPEKRTPWFAVPISQTQRQCFSVTQNGS